MDREHMLAVTTACRAALGNEKLLPALACFWFADGRVHAHNDRIAIDAPFHTDGLLRGGIKGTPVLKFLKAAGARTVNAKEDGKGGIRLNASRSHITQPLLSTEESLFTFPEYEEGVRLEVTEELFLAFQKAALCMGETGNPSFDGVTAVIGGEWATLYSTDLKSLGVVNCAAPPDVEVVAGMSTPFVKTMLDLSAQHKLTEVWLSEACTVALYETGVRLWGANRTTPDQKLFEGVREKRRAKNPAEMPAEFHAAIARTFAVLPSKGAKTMFQIKDGFLTMRSKSADGVVEDEMPIDEEHETVTAFANPTRIEVALPYVHSMQVTPDGIALVGPNCEHYVMAYAEDSLDG